MDDLIGMISTNASPTDISDKIKEILYNKAAENIDSVRPYVASDMFGTMDSFVDIENEKM